MSFFARAYSTIFSSPRSRSSSSASTQSTPKVTSPPSSSSSSFAKKDDSSLFRKTSTTGPLANHHHHSSTCNPSRVIQDKEDESRSPTSVDQFHSHNLDDCQARLLREFSRSTCSTVLIQEEECLLCLGEFSKENPQICTLCSCGENRTKFHYPCLLMWLEKKPVCPTCDSSIFYQVRAMPFFFSLLVLMYSCYRRESINQLLSNQADAGLRLLDIIRETHLAYMMCLILLDTFLMSAENPAIVNIVVLKMNEVRHIIL